MDRRKFLSLSTAAFISISTPISLEASMWDRVKKFITEEYRLTFAEFYPKALWKKSYFTWITMGVTVVAAGAFSYFTAGAGAPEAAAGVSTVASWIGGGGAGSYMAGLSTVGSAVGGNAMVGAAILNGISVGAIGWGATKVSLTLATKVATLIDASMSGFVIIKSNNDDGGSIYVFDIRIPKDIGSDEVKDLTEEIYKVYEKKQDALKDKEYAKARILDENLRNYYLLGTKMLKKELLKASPNIYNLIVLGIITYKVGDIDLYHQALNRIFSYEGTIEKRSLLYYLLGIYYLSIPNNEKIALHYFESSYYEENYVVEPVLIIIDLLAQDYDKNKIVIINWVKNAADNYDEDKYDGRGLLNLYYKAATVSFLNRDWNQSIEYYKKAYDELGLLGKLIWTTKPIKKYIKLYIAICYKHLGNYKKVNEYLNDALGYCENNKEKEEIRKVYNES